MSKDNLIVCISDNHNRPKIEYLNYDAEDEANTDIMATARLLKKSYDLVYIVPFEPYDIDFILGVMKNGNRI